MFVCIGTTRGEAGSADAFVKVEVGITRAASEIAKAAGLSHVSLVSAQGANKDIYVPTTLIHPLLYIRTLGEKQQAVLDQHFPSVTIFQPGMLNRLVGDRTAENVINWMIPGMSLRVDTLARAMVQDAEQVVDAQQAKEKLVGEEECKTKEVSNRVVYVSGNTNIAALANI